MKVVILAGSMILIERIVNKYSLYYILSECSSFHFTSEDHLSLSIELVGLILFQEHISGLTIERAIWIRI
jgi:hypothetical protein